MRKLLAYHKRCGEVASKVVYNHRNAPFGHHLQPTARNNRSEHIPCGQWWLGYLDTVERNARLHPLQLAHKNAHMISEFSDLGFQCNTCSHRAPSDLARLGQTLELEIRSAIAAVGFQSTSIYVSTLLTKSQVPEIVLNEDDFLIIA